MHEKLLQFLWQHQYFDKKQLLTAGGEPLEIIKPGTFNTNQGPDFLNARLRCGKTLWAGHIELHVLATDWQKHGHTGDTHYRNVVLHVVWKNDWPAGEHMPFPILEMQNRVPKVLLERYRRLMDNAAFIPCGKAIAGVNPLILTAWKEKLLVERLQEKVRIIFAELAETGDHWEEVFWRRLCHNFGTKVNSSAFMAMARILPLAIILRNRHSLPKLEALLMGQCGLLNDSFRDDYPLELKREFLALKKKYHLPKPAEEVLFLRMRPLAFPTIRLSQLARLYHDNDNLFAKVLEARNSAEIGRLFRLPASDYWDNHYRFDHSTAKKNKTMGVEMINNIILNTLAPFLFAWGMHQQNEKLKQRALKWFAALPREENNITRGFRQLGVAVENAFDSQALVQLKNHYCREKRCLECAAGSAILRNGNKASANGGSSSRPAL